MKTNSLITEENVMREFENVDGKIGVYVMHLTHGHMIFYANGRWGTYWKLGTSSDQYPEYIGQDECLKKALDDLKNINELVKKGFLFEGFEKSDDEIFTYV